MDTAIPTSTRFVSTTLHTDTVVYEIIARTDRTMRLRRTRDAAHRPDMRADEGAHGLRPHLIDQEPDADGAERTVRLRKDGSYRLYDWSALRPAPERDGVPYRYVDYRV